jgi:pimeloyl-ACP methyl ester carboxylesterase
MTMSEVVAATTRSEAPIFFPAGNERLFGIITAPVVRPNGTAAILLSAGRYRSSIGRNRFFVRICRHLAGEGYHAMRFDYHGGGESTGTLKEFRLDRPFVEDLDGAVRFLETRGLSNFVLVGSCFGARTALSYAASMGPSLRGIVLIAAPLRDDSGLEGFSTKLAMKWNFWDYLHRGLRVRVVRGLFDRDRRRLYSSLARGKWKATAAQLRWRVASQREDVYPISSKFLEPLVCLVQRRVPVMFVYGTEDEDYADFHQAKGGRLGELLGRGGPLIEVRTLPGRVHGLASVAVQDEILRVVVAWLDGQGQMPEIDSREQEGIQS